MNKRSMYLSRLLLNPEHAQARKDLASPYELHRTLGRAFPMAASNRYRSECSVLFRIEPVAPNGQGSVVLVQSISEPDWNLLPQGYALRIDGPKPFDPLFTEGQRLRFRLVANPVRRVRVEGKKHPRREALVHPKVSAERTAQAELGYLDWLKRQAEASGFTVEDVADAPFRLGRKHRVQDDPEKIKPIGKAKLPHFGVRFDGVLEVTDSDKLLEAVRKGIGPAKAFGFGLLSLARAE